MQSIVQRLPILVEIIGFKQLAQLVLLALLDTDLILHTQAYGPGLLGKFKLLLRIGMVLASDVSAFSSQLLSLLLITVQCHLVTGIELGRRQLLDRERFTRYWFLLRMLLGLRKLALDIALADGVMLGFVVGLLEQLSVDSNGVVGVLLLLGVRNILLE
jgi:hypothetical protein